MITAEILGGLGNQLFEYAHDLALSIKLNQELYFDLTFFDKYHRSDELQNIHINYKLNKFNINIKIAKQDDIDRLKRKLIKPDIIRWSLKKLGTSGFYSNSNHFDELWCKRNDISNLKNKKDFYFSGYFGNQKYFSEIEDIIRQEFTLKESFNSDNEKFLSLIKDSNSISIHIRRGDYINNNYFAELHLDYYREAINYMESCYPDSTYFIFSDDMTWVKENLKLDVETIIVDINDSETDYMELMLMAACQHNIIANSTFSWWGAWLNNNPKKIVIAPKIWYGNALAQTNYKKGNLVPPSWKKI